MQWIWIPAWWDICKGEWGQWWVLIVRTKVRLGVDPNGEVAYVWREERWEWWAAPEIPINNKWEW